MFTYWLKRGIFSEDFIHYETFHSLLEQHIHRFQLRRQAWKPWSYVSKAATGGEKKNQQNTPKKTIPPLPSSSHSCANSTSSNRKIVLQFQRVPSTLLDQKQCEIWYMECGEGWENCLEWSLNLESTILGISLAAEGLIKTTWWRLPVRFAIPPHLKMRCFRKQNWS